MRDPPLLEHTGTGQLTIINYNEKKQYGVFDSNGTLVDAPIVDGLVQLGQLYGEYRVSYVSQPLRGTAFCRLAITYTTESITTCVDNCGVAYQCPGTGDGVGCRPCWGYENDGNFCCGGICCGGSRGQTCETTTRQVKNPTPSGFTERYGEWMWIENPVEASTRDIGVLSLSKVEWDQDYYIAVPMPVPHQAQVFNEDTGEPRGEYLENVPAWDYDIVYFIYYNLDGDVVWMKDYYTDPECFTIVQKSLMTDYEMWVSNLPPADEGTWEFVIANEEQEFVRLEGNV